MPVKFEFSSAQLKEAIQIMILNRIDKLDKKLDNDLSHMTDDWIKTLARIEEAKYILATCLDKFVPRRIRK